MQKQSIKAEKRKVIGRKVKTLRREGILPANIYGKKIKSEAVRVNIKDFAEVFSKVGETGLIELVLEGKKRPVLIHNVQTDPITDMAVHADFFQVDLKEKVTAQIPVELTGESSTEKEGKGTVVQYIDEIEVEALPTDLLEKFEIDLTVLKEVDDAVKVEDLKVEKSKVDIKNEPDQIIVKVEPPRKEEEEVKPEPEEGEGEETPSEEEPSPDAEKEQKGEEKAPVEKQKEDKNPTD